MSKELAMLGLIDVTTRSLQSVFDPSTMLVITTDSEIYKFLNGSGL